MLTYLFETKQIRFKILIYDIWYDMIYTYNLGIYTGQQPATLFKSSKNWVMSLFEWFSPYSELGINITTNNCLTDFNFVDALETHELFFVGTIRKIRNSCHLILWTLKEENSIVTWILWTENHGFINPSSQWKRIPLFLDCIMTTPSTIHPTSKRNQRLLHSIIP